MPTFPSDAFADVLVANAEYADLFQHYQQSGTAARGLAIVTCMDSRVDPLAIVGMDRGDVKILRNAGSRVTADVLRTLVLATYLLGVDRVLVMPHTDCRMTKGSDDEVHATILNDYGIDTRSLEFRVVQDQVGALAADLTRIRADPYLPRNLVVAGAIYDVATGRLHPKDL